MSLIKLLEEDAIKRKTLHVNMKRFLNNELELICMQDNNNNFMYLVQLFNYQLNR